MEPNQPSGLTVVYRTLRRISKWTLAFYSEVYVTGRENVPADGPVLLLSCHHNDSIDVATLSVTIPHGRPIGFWAKAGLFRNPVVRAILESSGAIPVKRKEGLPTTANGVENGANGDDHAAREGRVSLFHSTFKAFDDGRVVSLFPEGASYSGPEIQQVKDGAAWLALEYAQWQAAQINRKNGQTYDVKPLTVIPVGIVYTDKAWFRSRVRVEYGQPLPMEEFVSKFRAAGEEAQQHARSVVKNLTMELERSLKQLTINAPNWDVWMAARIAMDIVYGGNSKIPIEEWLAIFQFFIRRVSAQTNRSNMDKLLVYYALLQRTSTAHGDLVAILSPHRTDSHPVPSRLSVIFQSMRQAAAVMFNPSFTLFLPPLVAFVPAYVVGALASRLLTKPREDESVAQYKGVCGGVVFGLVSTVVGVRIASLVAQTAFVQGLLSRAPFPVVFRLVGTVTTIYWTTWLLFRWHNALVSGNYARFQRLKTSWKVLSGVLPPASHDIPTADLGPYTRPLYPYQSPHVKYKTNSTVENDPSNTAAGGMPPAPSATGRRLIRHLLRARMEAERAVRDMKLREMVV